MVRRKEETTFRNDTKDNFEEKSGKSHQTIKSSGQVTSFNALSDLEHRKS